MKTVKNIIGLGVVTGVVVFAFIRSLNRKNQSVLPENEAKIQLV